MAERSLPQVFVSTVPGTIDAEISADSTFPANVWGRIAQICVECDPRARVGSHRITMSWAGALAAIPDIAKLRSEHGFSMAADAQAEERLRRVRVERDTVRQALDAGAAPLATDELLGRLKTAGFDSSKRQLTSFQLRDLAQLAAIPHGANFSVPGAGKTTVTLALHLLIKQPGMHVLVICPKNALAAWDSVVTECISEDAPDRNAEPFWHLDGDDDRISSLLASGGTRFVITYDRVVRSPALLRSYLASHPVHLILDESHRIKSGDYSLRGRIVGEVAPLPVRRDILTGTPIPNGLADIEAQVEFLWPGEGYGRRVLSEGNARHVLRGLFVRTTKADLQLPPVVPHFEPVQMSKAQLALYAYLKSAVIPALKQAMRTHDIARPIRVSVMRLLQATSNPQAAVAGLANDAFRWGNMPAELFESILAEGSSQKILNAVQLARQLAIDNKRCVIWTIFRSNVDQLVTLLADVGVTSIDGRVPTGDVTDPNTREGRVMSFHQDDGPMVLVANPAACSEGINLHRAAHDAIYLDRSYNAGHYLQSRDRIHRLGLPKGTVTNVTLLQSIASDGVGTIDHSVSRRLKTKLEAMDQILNDEDIRRLALDEEDADESIERDVDFEDIEDLLEQLITGSMPSQDDEE